MNAQPCDALALFGVTGDLAGKMQLPAIDALIGRRSLDIPLVAVARYGAPIAERVRDNLGSDVSVRSVQTTIAEAFGVSARGAFYDCVGALRGVVPNHLLQLVTVLAMELPDRADAHSWQHAPVGALSLPLARYSAGSWGPAEADRMLPAGERWHDPAPMD